MKLGRNKPIISLLTVLSCISILGFSTAESSSGSFDIIAPQITNNHLCINLNNAFSYAEKDFTINASESYGNAYAYSLYLGMNFSFTEWLEMTVNTGLMTDILYNAVQETSMISYGLRDSKVGLKINGNFLADMPDYVNGALYGYFRMNTGTLYDTTQYAAKVFSNPGYRNEGGIFRNFTSNGTDAGILGIAGFSVNSSVPVNININAGYEFRNPHVTNDSINNDLILYGISLSAGFGHVIPIIEFSGIKYLDSRINGGSFTGLIKPGIRFVIGKEFALDAACGISVLNNSDSLILNCNNDIIEERMDTGWGAMPFWEASLGISYCRDVSIRPKPIIVIRKPTLITGRILDKETGIPRKAVVTMPGYKEDVSVLADSNGFYFLEVMPGKHRVRVDIDGYKWQETEVRIKEGETKIFDFALNIKQSSLGIVKGIVKDKSGEFPLSAKIYFPGTLVDTAYSSSSTGEYELEAIEGMYQIAAVLEGYSAFSAPIEIKGSQTTLFNIDLLKKGGRLELKGIYFETGLATIKPESYIVLDEAVTLLKNNPKVKIEVQGHTDNVGSTYSNQILSQARAEAVRNYLISYSISSKRITAKGYGETMPIASNRTETGRAKNRRIEFLILGDGK